MIAVSSIQEKHNTLLCEIVLIKKNHLDVTLKLNLTRWLYFRRYNFMIRNPKFEQNYKLSYLHHKKVKINKFTNFVGVWKVYRFDDTYEKIVCSLLLFCKNYRVQCLTDRFDDDIYYNQPCHLSIADNDSLCLTSAPDYGSKKITTMYLDKSKKTDYHSGTMITYGKESDFPISRFIILKRQENIENIFEDDNQPLLEEISEYKHYLESFGKRKIKNLITSEDQIFTKIYKMLLGKIEKYNSPPDWIFQVSDISKKK